VDDDEFIRRFLIHTLPPGFQRIRYFGFPRHRHVDPGWNPPPVPVARSAAPGHFARSLPILPADSRRCRHRGNTRPECARASAVRRFTTWPPPVPACSLRRNPGRRSSFASREKTSPPPKLFAATDSFGLVIQNA
jgi:hypothetical protein